MLSDATIKRLLEDHTLNVGRISAVFGDRLAPLDDSQLQPASIDLRLDRVEGVTTFMDRDLSTGADYWEFHLEAGQFALGATQEWVSLPDNIAGRVEGKSTWGRRGLAIHFAGFVDPGVEGHLTLELKNLSHKRLVLKQGDPICQISFDFLDVSASRPYGHPELKSHYQHQRGVTEAWNK